MRTAKYINRLFLALIMMILGLMVAVSSGTLAGVLIGITLPLLVMATVICRTI